MDGLKSKTTAPSGGASTRNDATKDGGGTTASPERAEAMAPWRWGGFHKFAEIDGMESPPKIQAIHFRGYGDSQNGWFGMESPFQMKFFGGYPVEINIMR